jgi:hypothetical protein
MSTTKRKRKRKYRVERSVLSGLPIREINWRDWAPDFVLVLPLLLIADPLEAFRQLQASVQTYTNRRFDGTVTSWQSVCTADRAAIAMIHSENPAFFSGSNATVFSVFNFPTSTIDDPSHQRVVEAQDVAELVAAYSGFAQPRSSTSTAAKALVLWAQNEDDQLLRNKCESVLSGSYRHAAEVRAKWNAVIAAKDLRPNVDWAVKLLSWGLEQTPCVIAAYEPPAKPPWPISALEPIAMAMDAIYNNVIRISDEPVADRHIAEVLSGLLRRIQDLARLIRSNSSRNQGMATEIMLRCLADTAVQTKWLLFKNDVALYEQFQGRSHASEKGLLDELRTRLRSSGITNEAADTLLEAEYNDLHRRAGRWPELLDVVYGPWSDLSTTAMFKEVPETDAGATFTTWTRSSDAVHGAWRSIDKYQMTPCENAFHIGHHVSIVGGPVTAGVTPVLSSMLIPLDVMACYAERYPERGGLVDSIERQRTELVGWVRTHQRTDGSFNWHDQEE